MGFSFCVGGVAVQLCEYTVDPWTTQGLGALTLCSGKSTSNYSQPFASSAFQLQIENSWPLNNTDLNYVDPFIWTRWTVHFKWVTCVVWELCGMGTVWKHELTSPTFTHEPFYLLWDKIVDAADVNSISWHCLLHYITQQAKQNKNDPTIKTDSISEWYLFWKICI